MDLAPEYLSIAELKVFDEAGDNRALGNPASQSRTHVNYSRYSASKTPDGNFEDFTHTEKDSPRKPLIPIHLLIPCFLILSRLLCFAALLLVDLQGDVAVSKDVIYNRKDCGPCKQRLSAALVSLLRESD